jgi:membrane fusion protein, heavy metal efflux system
MNNRPPILSVAFIVCAAFALTACTDKATDAPKPQAAAVDPLIVAISESQNSLYSAKPLEQVMLSSTITYPGRLEVTDQNTSRIGSSVTGRIASVLVELGQVIRPGQVLAQLTSPELTSAQLNYLKTSSNLALAERAAERAKQMIAADVISNAEFQRRETELAIARAEQRAAQDQLRLMGLTDESVTLLQTQGRIQPLGAITSRQGGIVIERKVSTGQVVQPGDSIFTIAELGSLWATASLPEQAAKGVQKGQKVEVLVPAIEKNLKANIVYVSDTVQPETRTVLVRAQVDNAKRELKPQMLVTMNIQNPEQLTLAIPTTALVREGDKDHVFIQINPNTYRLTPVELEAQVKDYRPVKKGLNVGDIILVQGGFHLNNERQQKLLTNSSAGNPTAGQKK